MMVPGSGMRIVVATCPVDFRKGHDGLAAVVERELGLDPYSGVVVVFRSRRADRVKVLWWDGTGLVLASKRLEQGRFAWPTVRDGVMRLSPAQFEGLFEGLDWTRPRPPCAFPSASRTGCAAAISDRSASSASGDRAPTPSRRDRSRPSASTAQTSDDALTPRPRRPSSPPAPPAARPAASPCTGGPSSPPSASRSGGG